MNIRNRPLCSIGGCDKAASRRGWCKLHYDRWRIHGDPLTVTRSPRGAGSITKQGYHVRTENGVEKREHVRLAEKALGKPLPPGAVVHHVDGNRLNNDPSNLLICGRDYHMLLHARMRAMDATGDPNKRPCGICKQYDDVANMRPNSGGNLHLRCRREKAHPPQGQPK